MKEPTTIMLPAYEAMEAKDRQAKLGFVVRLASGERLYLDYPDVHLKRLSPDETVLAVFCYGLNIVMWGRVLGAVADALHGKNVAWVQEFDSARWTKPTDPAAPFIERIEVYAKKDDDGPQPEKSEATGESRARH
jgi:hypothetical protein